MSNQPGGNGGPEPAIDRERFGAIERRRPRGSDENRAPISCAELSKGPTELAEDRGARVNWAEFGSASVLSRSAVSGQRSLLPAT